MINDYDCGRENLLRIICLIIFLSLFAVPAYAAGEGASTLPTLDAAGFTDQTPTYEMVTRNGYTQPHITIRRPHLAFWIISYGVQKGDRFEFKIVDPKGKIYVESTQQEDKVSGGAPVKQIRGIASEERLQVGTYTGRAALIRTLPDGKIIERTIERTVAVGEPLPDEKPVSHAGEMKFGWPVACTLNQDCWIWYYVDVDPSESGIKDFQCGEMVQPGHEGTDIAIERKAMAGNVSVLAAADGRVLSIETAVEDWKSEAEYLRSDQNDPRRWHGNKVVITHENGWTTRYGHLKKGSISVVPGQYVKKGERLGAVGQSGRAQFPHLHFDIRHNHAVVDPFTGMGDAAGCKVQGTVSLWDSPQIAYYPLLLHQAGFSDRENPPDSAIDIDDSVPHITTDAPYLTFSIFYHGVYAGDLIEMEILDPEGNVYMQASRITHLRGDNQMVPVSTSTRDKPLRAGTYTGKATVLRTLPDGQTIKRTIERSIVIE